MTIFALLFCLVVIGVTVYALTTLVPMDAKIARIIQLAGVLVALWVVAAFFGIAPTHAPPLR